MYDPALVNFAICLRVAALLLTFSMIYLIYIYIRDIAMPSKSWTRFNVILTFLMIFATLITTITSIAVNEVITNRLGVDKLPNDPSLNAVSAVITSVSYYEFTVGLIYILYLRSYSIVQLQRKYQLYFLKFAVFMAMACFQASMIFYMMSFFAGFSFIPVTIAGDLGTAFYFLIDVYYLYQFITLVRKGKADRKLNIIAKYGIFQTCIYFITVILGFISNTSLALSIWVIISPWLNCVGFVKMCYDLRAAPEKNDATSEKPSIGSAKSNAKSLPPLKSHDYPDKIETNN